MKTGLFLVHWCSMDSTTQTPFIKTKGTVWPNLFFEGNERMREMSSKPILRMLHECLAWTFKKRITHLNSYQAKDPGNNICLCQSKISRNPPFCNRPSQALTWLWCQWIGRWLLLNGGGIWRKGVIPIYEWPVLLSMIWQPTAKHPLFVKTPRPT